MYASWATPDEAAQRVPFTGLQGRVAMIGASSYAHATSAMHDSAVQVFARFATCVLPGALSGAHGASAALMQGEGLVTDWARSLRHGASCASRLVRAHDAVHAALNVPTPPAESLAAGRFLALPMSENITKRAGDAGMAAALCFLAFFSQATVGPRSVVAVGAVSTYLEETLCGVLSEELVLSGGTLSILIVRTVAASTRGSG